jgi:glutathione S-transferase
MRAGPEVTLFHSPQTRSTGALMLLEELRAPYALHVLDLRGRQQQRQPEFLAINPMGKVPTIRHGDAVVTEQVAVFLYLADLFPEAAPASTSPYGDFDTMLSTLLGQLARGPYFLGERFTALDILWGQGLAWILQFGLIPSSNQPPSSDLLRDYVARIQARPAVVRALAKDSELAAGLQASAAAASSTVDPQVVASGTVTART